MIRKMKTALLDTGGITTIEILLVLIVLIGLILIFKNQLTGLINSIFKTIVEQSGTV